MSRKVMSMTRKTTANVPVTRRFFLSGVGCTAIGLSPAFALDPDHEAMSLSAREWADGFDTATAGPGDVLTSTPTMSAEVLGASEQAMQRYSDLLARGGWSPVPAQGTLRLGLHDPIVMSLRQRLMASGDLSEMVGSPGTFDTYVEAAVKRFQARHGIVADGVVGDTTLAALNVPAATRLAQLATNVARLRMLVPQPSPERFVMVNIPAVRVEAVERGTVVSMHRAVVGRVDRPSPIINSKIIEVNFHPFWTVPVSIIKRDLIPVMQKDPTYLERYRIRVYDPKGNELRPEQIDWTTDEATKYLFRQDPSKENSLGLVRINFPNPDGVYMHDTPNKSLFNDDYRFDSSGCVRIQEVRDLVTWLLRDTPGQTPEQVARQFGSFERLDVKIAKPVPVYWIYVTAWGTPEGVVNFRDDIYALDATPSQASSDTQSETDSAQPHADQDHTSAIGEDS